MIDRRPAVIAQCAAPRTWPRAVRFGREHGLEIAVRGGGHSVAGKALTEGGLVIDLRRMNGVTVDPEARTAIVGGGATMGHLDRATQPYGLATTGGRVSTTGVGGFTLGGGSGLARPQVRPRLRQPARPSSSSPPTGEQSCAPASTENPELFWALHGGGGNFGVATSLTFRLHELPVGDGGAAAVAARRPAPVVLRAYRDFMDAAPDEVGGGVLYLTGPPGGVRARRTSSGSSRCAVAGHLRRAGGRGARASSAPLLALRPEGGDDRRDALRRAAVHARRPARATATTGRPSTSTSFPDEAVDRVLRPGGAT